MDPASPTSERHPSTAGDAPALPLCGDVGDQGWAWGVSRHSFSSLLLSILKAQPGWVLPWALSGCFCHEVSSLSGCVAGPVKGRVGGRRPVCKQRPQALPCSVPAVAPPYQLPCPGDGAALGHCWGLTSPQCHPVPVTLAGAARGQ